jgi:hypothetical protein
LQVARKREGLEVPAKISVEVIDALTDIQGRRSTQ